MEGARRKNGEIIPRDAVFVDSIENGERSPSTDLAKVAGWCFLFFYKCMCCPIASVSLADSHFFFNY